MYGSFLCPAEAYSYHAPTLSFHAQNVCQRTENALSTVERALVYMGRYPTSRVGPLRIGIRIAVELRVWVIRVDWVALVVYAFKPHTLLAYRIVHMLRLGVRLLVNA